MSDKTEWPTAERIEDLRQQGIVPYSRFASSLAVLLAVLASLYLSAPKASFWSDLLSRGITAGNAAEFRGPLLRIFLIPPLAGACACMLIGLAQTRFLFRPGELKLTIARLNPFGSVRLGVKARAFLSALARACLALVLGAVLFTTASPPILELLNHRPSYLMTWPKQLLSSASPIVVMALLGAGLIALLIARLRFMLSHRMSRKEVEEDSEAR